MAGQLPGPDLGKDTDKIGAAHGLFRPWPGVGRLRRRGCLSVPSCQFLLVSDVPLQVLVLAVRCVGTGMAGSLPGRFALI